MHVQYPLTEAKRARILARAWKAMERRVKIKKRTGLELERACAWCAVWMMALGVRKFEQQQEPTQ